VRTCSEFNTIPAESEHARWREVRSDRALLATGSAVTVFVAHRGCPELLVGAIESVRAQTFTDWHLVIVDDDSLPLDRLQSLSRKWSDSRITWLSASRNVGQFRIYNRLLPHVTSPFLMLQDADDISYPERLEILLSALDSKRVDMVGSAVARVDPSAADLGAVYPPEDVNHALRFRRKGGIVIGPTLALRTNFVRSLNGFDGATLLGGDTEFVCRAVFAGRVSNLRHVLYRQTVRRDSLTGNASTGFGSKARQDYSRYIARRFYANLARKWTGSLAGEHLFARPNDVDFTLRWTDGALWPG
jgi:glycosyltransferase involved in cell wall biosynthesis